MNQGTTSSTHGSDDKGDLGVPREWLQTQQGDWILPSINARHFGTQQTSSPARGAQGVLEQHFGNSLHQEDRLYILIGSDSGQLLRYIREHAPLPRGARWLVVEPEHVMKTLQRNPEIDTYCDEFVQLVSFDNWESRAKLLQLPSYFRIDGVVLVRSLGALDGTDPEYIKLTAFFDAHLTAERFRTTLQIDIAPFIEPQILSAPNYHGTIDPFMNIFKGKQAVIIAGGPSLDDQIDWLTEHQDALFLIAVSRISYRLVESGITPDLVVTVDPHPVSLTVSRAMFEFPEKTVLVTGTHPYPGIANRWPHALFCAGPIVPWHDEALSSGSTIRMSGPTVTHMAAQLAAFMGFSEIVFCGLDLCHSKDGQTHASGSSEASLGPLMDFSALPVTTNRGESSWTTPDFYAGIDAMSEIAKRIATVRFINPSPNAAFIEHVQHQPIESITVPREPFDRAPLDQILNATTPSIREGQLHALEISLAEVEEELEKVANLAQLGLESNRAYFNVTHPARQKRHKRRMQAIDQLFKRKFHRSARLAQRAATRAIALTDLPHDFFAIDQGKAERLANQYYAAIEEQARRLSAPIRLARARVATRLLELSREVSREEIAYRYLEHGEPERIRWLDANLHGPEGPYAEKSRAEYDRWIDTLLNENQTKQSRERSPRASLRQIERLFSNRNTNALKALADSLDRHQETETARPYARYAHGLSRELDGELVEAAEAHARVIAEADTERDTVLLEHALLRMAHINLEAREPTSALTALQTAAALNPSHWRFVARLALLENDAETGITALIHHLEQFPSDIERIKQLVRLFVALEVPEGIPFCEQYLPYCPPAARNALNMFLEDARQALGPPSNGS